MRTVGLLGGMSWQSTQIYYKLINEDVQARKGGLHSAPLLIKSFDFAEIEMLQASGQWADAGRLLEEQAAALQAAGAEAIALATNTMHKLADYIISTVTVPFLHIAMRQPKRFWLAHHGSLCCWQRPLQWNRISTPLLWMSSSHPQAGRFIYRKHSTVTSFIR